MKIKSFSSPIQCLSRQGNGYDESSGFYCPTTEIQMPNATYTNQDYQDYS
ncbi:MAG: hypothetical protein JW822_08785 [Spirochaetales bacterium]|nr:hypothetical protein [Spirochaetales bacterium]